MKRESGFTLIELMIVVAIIAIIAAIAIPNLLAARLAANETSAISTLRNITSCQGQFQAGAKADVDRDGTGEFGMFREMSGASAVRTDASGTNTGGAVLNPPVLSGAFRTLNASNQVSRSGYLFKLYLPNDSGLGVCETAGDGAVESGTPINSDLAETTWCCYAWPASYGNSGNRTFFVNQGGDITATELSSYSGSGAFLYSTGERAYINGGPASSITGRQAIGTIGRDSQRWKQVN